MLVKHSKVKTRFQAQEIAKYMGFISVDGTANFEAWDRLHYTSVLTG